MIRRHFEHNLSIIYVHRLSEELATGLLRSHIYLNSHVVSDEGITQLLGPVQDLPVEGDSNKVEVDLGVLN
jgi:hypothetical protein